MIERFGIISLYGFSGTAQKVSRLFLAVLLQSYARDKLPGKFVEKVQALFHVVHEDNRIFESDHTIATHLGSKKFAAKQRGYFSRGEGKMKEAPQQGDGQVSVKPQI